MMVVNSTKNKIVVTKLKVAGNFFQRMKGLLGSKELPEGHGLLIPGCQGIHTFGMSYPIDVLYLDDQGTVVTKKESVAPNLFGPVQMAAKAVLELPAGMILRTGTDIGDRLLIDSKPLGSC
jgi:uncharacterized protein